MKVILLSCALAALFVLTALSCSNKQASESTQNDEEVISEPDDEMDVINEADIPAETFTIEAVDLGLSVLWANANIGADGIYETGDYYAWGESTPKSSYTLDNYFDYYIEVKEGGYVHRGFKVFNKVGQSLAGTEYDIAHNLLGGNWRMPTIDECKELISRCLMEYNYDKDIVKVKGSNGTSIILPNGGYWDSDGLNKCDGYFWTAELPSADFDDSEAYAAIFGNFSGRDMGLKRMNRGYGLNIRAVMDRDASSAIISDGDYDMMGKIGTIDVRTFELKIEGSHVTGIIDSYTIFEGTKDENNTLLLKKTNGVEPFDRMEGVFDGKAFRGTYYNDEENEGRAFKFIMRINKNK